MPYGVYEKNEEIYMKYSSDENTVRKTEKNEKLLGIYDGEKDAKEFMKKYMSENPKLKYIKF